MICHKCNAENQPEAKFCAKCGSPLIVPQSEGQQSSVPQDSGTPDSVSQYTVLPGSVPQYAFPPGSVPRYTGPRFDGSRYTAPPDIALPGSVPRYAGPRFGEYTVPQAEAGQYSIPSAYGSYAAPSKKKSKLPLVIGIIAFVAAISIVYVFFWPF